MKSSIKTCLVKPERIANLTKSTIFIAVIVSLAFTANLSAVPTLTEIVTLDGDSPGTGSNLLTQNLVLAPYGTISFSGEFKSTFHDPDFASEGASGNTFNILYPGDQSATLSFDFDVYSLNFIYGGNYGNIDVKAFDEYGNEVDSFYQASTDDGMDASAKTLDRGSSAGIRSLRWTDDNVFFTGYAALDNIKVTVVNTIPTPSAIVLAGIGISFVWGLRKRKIV